jgi:dolichol-phosphate mannosyltransferase
MRTIQAGLRVVEVPITFVERVHGTSKMSRAIVVEALWRVTIWGLTGRGRRLRRHRAGGGGIREIVPPD